MQIYATSQLVYRRGDSSTKLLYWGLRVWWQPQWSL